MNYINKIFFIGFNKTGTTTYHTLLSDKFRSISNPYWTELTRRKWNARIAEYFSRWDCYSDGELCDFKKLDKIFPNSKFILNTRNLRNWVYSRIYWVNRDSDQYIGKFDLEYRTSPSKQKIIRQWIERRKSYHRNVHEYFGKNNTEKIMVIDIENDNIVDKLSKFLNVTLNYTGKRHNPKRNGDDSRVKTHIQYADEVLSEYGSENLKEI